MSDKNGNPNSYVNRLFRSIEGDSAVVKEKATNSIGQSTDRSISASLGQLDSKSETAVALSSLKSSLSADFNAIRSMIRKQDTVIQGLKKNAGGAVSQVSMIQGQMANQLKGLNRQVNELQNQVRDIRKDLEKLKKAGSGMGGAGAGSGSGIGSLLGGAAAGWGAWKTLGAIGRVAGAALPYAAPLAIGAGALYGLNKIGEANEARDKKLGIDKDSTQDEIEAKRKKFHRDRKNQGYRELHNETNKLRQQQGQKTITAPSAAQYRAPSAATRTPQTFDKMHSQKYDLTFADNYYRQKVEDQKSQFMQFGKLPGGFEFTEGYMGRLGTPAALRAAGIQPLSGGGSYTGPSRSSNGPSYVPSGNYTSPPAPSQSQQPGARPAPSTNTGQGTGTPPSPPASPGQQPNSTAPGNATVTNNGQVERFSHLATERERFKQELEANPALKAKLLAVARSESGNQTGWTSTMEALFNRMSAHNAVGHGPKTIADALKESRGSYYDPIRTGIWRQRDAMIRSNPALAAQLEQAYQDAINGSNRSNLATQEGSAGVAASAARTQTIVAGPKTHGGQTFSRKDIEAYGRLHGVKIVAGEKNWAQRNQALIDQARAAAAQNGGVIPTTKPPAATPNSAPQSAAPTSPKSSAGSNFNGLPMNAGLDKFSHAKDGINLPGFKAPAGSGDAINELYDKLGLQAPGGTQRPPGMMKLGGPEASAEAKKMMVLGLPGLGNQLDPNALTRFMNESGASGVQKLFNTDKGWSPDWQNIEKSIMDAQKMKMGFNVMAHSAGVQTLRDMQKNLSPEAWKYFQSNLGQVIATGAHRNIGNGSVDQLKGLYGDKLKMFGDFSSRGLDMPMLKAKHFDMPNAALDQLYPKTVGRADQAPPQPKPMTSVNNLSQGGGLPDVGVATPGTKPAAPAEPVTTGPKNPFDVREKQQRDWTVERPAIGFPVKGLEEYKIQPRTIEQGKARSRGHHAGLDVAGKTGTPIVAQMDGRVVRIVNDPNAGAGYGRQVDVKYSDGTIHRFAHLNGVADGLKVGQPIKKGQDVAYLGTSGTSGAWPHLHWEVFENDKKYQLGNAGSSRDTWHQRMNPRDWLDKQNKAVGPDGRPPAPPQQQTPPGQQPPGPGPSTGTGPVPQPGQTRVGRVTVRTGEPDANGPTGDVLTNMQNNMGDNGNMIPWDATMPKPSNSGRILGIPVNPYFNPFKGHWDPNPNANGPILGKLSKEDYDKHRDPDAKPEERDPQQNLEREFENYKPIEGKDPNYVGANPNAPPEEAPKPPPQAGPEQGVQPPSGPVATNPGEFPSFKGDDQQESPGDGGSGSYGRCFV